MTRHILIVEDEMFLALELEQIVADITSADVIICRGVGEALREIEHRHFDFALLDVDVCDGTTFDLAETLASRGEAFAFVSGSSRADEARKTGAVGYVSKPYRWQDVRDLVQRGLAISDRAA